MLLPRTIAKRPQEISSAKNTLHATTTLCQATYTVAVWYHFATAEGNTGDVFSNNATTATPPLANFTVCMEKGFYEWKAGDGGRGLSPEAQERNRAAFGHLRDKGRRVIRRQTPHAREGPDESHGHLFSPQMPRGEHKRSHPVPHESIEGDASASDVVILGQDDPPLTAGVGEPHLIRSRRREKIVEDKYNSICLPQRFWDGVLAQRSIDEKD